MTMARLRPAQPVLPPLLNRVIFSQQQIQQRVQELGHQITEDYAGQDLVIFGVLKGVIFFQADLLRTIDLPVRSDLMAIAGYQAGEKRPPGTVRIIKDLDLDIYRRHVLVVEDMVDTGLTLNFILRMVRDRQPASLAVCALLNREGHRLAPNLPLKYVG